MEEEVVVEENEEAMVVGEEDEEEEAAKFAMDRLSKQQRMAEVRWWPKGGKYVVCINPEKEKDKMKEEKKKDLESLHLNYQCINHLKTGYRNCLNSCQLECSFVHYQKLKSLLNFLYMIDNLT